MILFIYFWSSPPSFFLAVVFHQFRTDFPMKNRSISAGLTSTGQSDQPGWEVYNERVEACPQLLSYVQRTLPLRPIHQDRRSKGFQQQRNGTEAFARDIFDWGEPRNHPKPRDFWPMHFFKALWMRISSTDMMDFEPHKMDRSHAKDATANWAELRQGIPAGWWLSNDLPSGNLWHSYRKSPFSMEKSTINGHFP